MSKGTGKSTGASAIRSSPGPPSSIESTIAGPRPTRRANRSAVRAPATAPTLPRPKITPISAADRPRSRTAYTMNVVSATLLNRLEVPVAAAMPRRYGLPSTYRSPAATSVRSPALGCPCSSTCRSGAGSSRRMRNTNAADAT